MHARLSYITLLLVTVGMGCVSQAPPPTTTVSAAFASADGRARPLQLEGYFVYLGTWSPERRTYVGARLKARYSRDRVASEIVAFLRGVDKCLPTNLDCSGSAPQEVAWPPPDSSGRPWWNRLEVRDCWALILADLCNIPVWVSEYETEEDQEWRIERLASQAEILTGHRVPVMAH